jgi:hypothetical protein
VDTVNIHDQVQVLALTPNPNRTSSKIAASMKYLPVGTC